MSELIFSPKTLNFNTLLQANHDNKKNKIKNFQKISLIDSDLILKQEELALPLINHVFYNLNELSNHYPNFNNWLENKVFADLYDVQSYLNGEIIK